VVGVGVAVPPPPPPSREPKRGAVAVTPEQIALVRASFAQVLPIADAAAALFYDRLFALDPSLRPLFRGDLTAQGRALMGLLHEAVHGLDRLDRLVPDVRALGRRHAGYGVEDWHYATVASALLWTLERGRGAAFTPETRAAWTAAYALLATVMQEGAADTPGRLSWREFPPLRRPSRDGPERVRRAVWPSRW
jgi:hemoglobin-like flavoprotein